MKIRDAVDSDLPAIVDIYNAAVATRIATAQLEPVTFEERRDWLKEHSPDRHPFWVLEIDGQVAGWLTIKPFILRCAYQGRVELSVYVDQKFRRRGVARAFIGRSDLARDVTWYQCDGWSHFRAQRTKPETIRTVWIRTLGIAPTHRSP